MAASSSSSLPSENEVEKHPYQDAENAGPKGAFEARQVKLGFYVRVDMPGVPPDGVKLFKYSDTRTVTFTGKAPILWLLDSSERVYAGYVVLDRDPKLIDIEFIVKNGCLRLFFPDAEGVLHFFPPKNHSSLSHQHIISRGSSTFWPCQDSYDDQIDAQSNVILGRVDKVVSHPVNCSCCKGVKRKSHLSVIEPYEYRYSNPYLLHGMQGVCDSKVLDGKTLSIRVDMPGLKENSSFVMVNRGNKLTAAYRERYREAWSSMNLGGVGPKEYRFDEGGRKYFCCVILLCDCCEIDGAVQQLKDGVLRVSMMKKKKLKLKVQRPQTDDVSSSRKY